eukprot:1154043-Pelagomonas_calceolata.AAC.2
MGTKSAASIPARLAACAWYAIKCKSVVHVANSEQASQARPREKLREDFAQAYASQRQNV